MANDESNPLGGDPITAAKLNDITSGTTAPTGTTKLWWDTANAQLKFYQSGAWTMIGLPIPVTIGNDFRIPLSLLGGTVEALAWNPAGTALVIVTDTTPYLFVYPYDRVLGFGAPVSPGVAPALGTLHAVNWSPDGAYIAVGGGASPYLSAYPWSGTAVGTKVADPGTLPAGSITDIAWNPAGTYIAAACSPSPYVQIWAWSGGAFGAKSTDLSGGNLPPSAMRKIAWNPATGLSLVGCSSGTPYINGWPVSAGGAWGAKFSNPATLPTGAGDSIAIDAAGTLVACGHDTTPFMSAYPYTDTGFGTKIANPPSLPPGPLYTVCWWEQGTTSLLVGASNAQPKLIAIALVSGAWAQSRGIAITAFRDSGGTGLQMPSLGDYTVVTGQARSLAVSADKHLAVLLTTTPFVTVTPPALV